MKLTPISTLGNKVLEVILLLIGQYVLQLMVLFTLPFFQIEDIETEAAISSNVPWIGSIVFGGFIMWLSRDKGIVAIPVGVLSIVLPLYGAVFYLLAKLQTKSEHG